MDFNKLPLPEKFVTQLMQLPETGMGYQQVTITLKNGEKLYNRFVFNCSLLEVQPTDTFTAEDITTITLQNIKAA